MLVLVEEETIGLMQQTAQQDDPIHMLRMRTIGTICTITSIGSSLVIMEASSSCVLYSADRC